MAASRAKRRSTDKRSLAERMRTLRVLWFAMCTSVVVVTMVSQLVPAQNPTPPAPLMLYLLGAVALVVVVVSALLPRLMYRQALLAADLNVVEEAVPGATALFRDAVPRQRVFDNPRLARNRAAALFTSPFIVSMAMNEVVAIFGLVLALQGFSISHVAPFFGAGLLLALLRFPSETRIYAPLCQAYSAELPAAPSAS